jgi:hypothetical protein
VEGDVQVLYRSAAAGIVTGILLALARISGETAPLLFTALNNQYWTADMSSRWRGAGRDLPVRRSPYDSGTHWPGPARRAHRVRAAGQPPPAHPAAQPASHD